MTKRTQKEIHIRMKCYSMAKVACQIIEEKQDGLTNELGKMVIHMEKINSMPIQNSVLIKHLPKTQKN